MSNSDLVNEVMDRLKERGFLMIPDGFIDQLITALHANVTLINTMTEIAKIESEMQNLSMIPEINRQVESLKNLSKNIAEIAFNVEDVRDEQRQ